MICAPLDAGVSTEIALHELHGVSSTTKDRGQCNDILKVKTLRTPLGAGSRRGCGPSANSVRNLVRESRGDLGIGPFTSWNVSVRAYLATEPLDSGQPVPRSAAKMAWYEDSRRSQKQGSKDP